MTTDVIIIEDEEVAIVETGLPGEKGDKGDAGDGEPGGIDVGEGTADELVKTNEAGDALSRAGTTTAQLADRSNHTGTQQLNTISDAGEAAALAVGITAGTVAAGDDARFTDARAPTAHAASHATGGDDALTPADIGAEVSGAASTAVSTHVSADDPHDDRQYTDDQLVNYVHQDAIGDTVAPLVGGLIPAINLPGFVDDVLEFADLASFPATGESGKIYVAIDTGRQWRWGGSAYTEMIASPGTTDDVTEGSSNLYHTAARVRAVVLTGISFVTATAITAADSILSALGKIQARLNLLGGAANLDVGTASGTVMAGDDSRAPTSGEKSALVGTAGTPGSGNKYVTNDDTRNSNSRTPSAHAASHATAGGDPIAPADIGAQATLVSGTNIKTVNSTSLLGSGNITVSATPAGSTNELQRNNAGAFGGATGVTWASNQLLITAQAAATCPLAVKAATSHSANLSEWQGSTGAVGAYVRLRSGVPAFTAARFELSSDPNNRYIDATGIYNNLAFSLVTTSASAYIQLAPGNNNAYKVQFQADTTNGRPYITPVVGIDLQLTGGDADAVPDRTVGDLFLTGGSCHANGQTITGGAVEGAAARLIGGEGASAATTAAAHGGNVYLTPGTGYGTGHDGYVIAEKLPTSSAGLPTGALWNDAGTLKIA